MREKVRRISPSEKTFPIAAEDRRAVLRAFNKAEASGQALVLCYQAGIAAWIARHPDHVYEYASLKAVDIILSTRLRPVFKELIDA